MGTKPSSVPRKIKYFSPFPVNTQYLHTPVPRKTKIFPSWSVKYSVFKGKQTGKEKNVLEVPFWLVRSGIVNYNLCLNAETEHAHTECDSSFTIICVPNQEVNRKAKKIKNSGSFEFVVSHEETIVIPMEIGTIITYSGYLLTHRQQIRNKDSEVPPFVNLVSYNSKRLFENMLESFRRYLHSD